MKQYHDHLKAILERGTKKPAARANMPSTISLFGYQNRYNLADGFPILTTKKMNFKHVVTELLWFLRGDTNIKYLLDNGFNLWNEDAYNYYCKIASKNTDESWNNIYIGIQDGKRVEKYVPMKVESYSIFTFEEFITAIKGNDKQRLVETYSAHGYTLGDCGFQYGRVWRDWDKYEYKLDSLLSSGYQKEGIDQIKNVIKSLKETPESRRHIVTAIDPAHDTELALYWCHAMFQFNCRPLIYEERWSLYEKSNLEALDPSLYEEGKQSELLDSLQIPKYYLDCSLYQRSADLFLGVPFNIASYALLTSLFAKLLNMIPGDFIHTFGDSHIYEDHIDAVNLLLTRTPKKLPTLNINTEFWKTESGECGIGELSIEGFLQGLQDDNFIKCLIEEDIQLSDYNPDPFIKAELSTGMKK